MMAGINAFPVLTRCRRRSFASSPSVPKWKAAWACHAHCRIAALEGISGFILKSRSPSCGLERVPVFDEAGGQVAQGSGLFAHHLMSAYPALPLAEEVQLLDVTWRDDFLRRVLTYARHQRQMRDA